MLERGKNIIKNKEIKHSLITLFLRGIGVLTLFGFTIFFNRNFNSSVVGDYEFTRMFLLVSGSICLLGSDISILYFSGKLKSEDRFYELKNLYYKISLLCFIFCIAVGFIFFVFFDIKFINSFFGSNNSYTIISTCILFLFFNVWTLFNTEVLRALNQIVWSELFRNTFKFFPIFFGAIILFQSGNEENIVFYYIFGFVILSLITTTFVMILLNKIPKSNHHHSPISYREIIDYSLPMGISSFVVYLFSTIDIIILRNYYSSSDVALYALGIKIMAILGMIILSINVNLSPQIAELYLKKEFDQLKQILTRSGRLIFIMSLIIGLTIIMFSDYILPIFGKEYSAAKTALIILVIGQILISSLGSSAIYLNMTGRPKVFRGFLLIALVINLSLNLILIPKFGIIGASITYVVTILFWNICSVIYIYRKDKIKIYIN
ncbi:polysaccharide biosynthesis C-terminal domain-containing protein [Empedobacter falsenii]|uniref:MATE family efflux transporter n=1 Tax=Empedobacter falsenii TaxID=343874 RepID=UPI002581470E|nr:MATE family efflux transporter [Empedobacter falsenii]MDM1298650.1 polysaccharide biosynthesis C-terminal domain-containing protein [Empedobacter falsenii]MDM1318443.1 polysaccharide biosynthesis C-terminal domain-containing protein [Empedobacter falsenii]